MLQRGEIADVELSSVAGNERFRKDIADRVGYEIKNLIAVPLRIDERKLGVLELREGQPDKAFTLFEPLVAALIGKSKAQGLTLFPLSVYTKGSLIKIEMALGRGRKQHDKRELIKKKEIDRRLRRVIRGRV